MKRSASIFKKLWWSGLRVRGSLIYLLLVAATALLAPLLANHRPLWINTGEANYFPAFSGSNTVATNSNSGAVIQFDDPSWVTTPGIHFLRAPIVYSPNRSDAFDMGYSPPFQQADQRRSPHYLGTGKRGDDILAGIIHGSRVSVTVGIFSMLLAGLIGITLGAFGGYFGDDRIRICRGTAAGLITGLLPAWFYSFHIRSYALQAALAGSTMQFLFQLTLTLLLFFLVLIFFALAGRWISRFSWFSHQVKVPADSLISRLTEMVISLPKLLLILAIAAIAKPSVLNLILIIGLTSWTEMARFTRAEMLSLREQDFIQSARSLGLKESTILLKHALPNGIATAMVALTFGVSAAILIESGLSFLGIGVEPGTVTWGMLLSEGRSNFSAWWLVVFPGLAIFATVTALNFIGEALREVMDPR